MQKPEERLEQSINCLISAINQLRQVLNTVCDNLIEERGKLNEKDNEENN